MSEDHDKWFQHESPQDVWNEEKDKDIFVHPSAIEQEQGYKTLEEGQRVEYDVATEHPHENPPDVEPLNQPSEPPPDY